MGPTPVQRWDKFLSSKKKRIRLTHAIYHQAHVSVFWSVSDQRLDYGQSLTQGTTEFRQMFLCQFTVLQF